jgi:glycerol-3-phosphate dehydrogenase (NAD(P)+)
MLTFSRGPRVSTPQDAVGHMRVTRAAVLGAGSWGTTFAKVLIDAGTPVTLWARRAELAERINTKHESSDYLPGVKLPPELTATNDHMAALAGADLVAFAIPAQCFRANLAQWVPYLDPDATLVSLMKGVELGTAKRMTEVIVEVAAAAPDRVAVVSGPNLAPEIAAEQPTATVVACIDLDRAIGIQHACANPYFRPYTNTDVIGCELGGAVKNVIALACGMAQGMGFGDNTRASIITRGLAETARLGTALGADPMTFAGLAGLGDLVATCESPLSRNRTFGERLGHGDSLAQSQRAAHGQVAEGVQSSRAILDLAQRAGVDVPITAAVEQVCFGGLDPRDTVRAMMSRAMKSEQADR